MLDTFKEQQQQYRALLDGSKVGLASSRTSPASLQHAFGSSCFPMLDTRCIKRSRCALIYLIRLRCFTQNLVPPLNGDKAAIKKYATDMENLRKKVPCLFSERSSFTPSSVPVGRHALSTSSPELDDGTRVHAPGHWAPVQSNVNADLTLTSVKRWHCCA